MSRAYCPTPDRCTAPKRGVCPCQVTPAMREKYKAAMADPEVKARHAAAMKAAWAGRALVVPAHLKAYAAKLKRCGIRGDALRRAIEAAS